MTRRMMAKCVVVVLLLAEVSGPLWAGSPPAATQNWALQFDGVDDYVNLGNGSSLRLSGDMTVCAWCKMAQGTSGRYLGILGKMTTTSPAYKGFCLARDKANKFHFWVGTGYILHGWESEKTYADSEWHHIAGVMDGGAMVIYEDGTVHKQPAMGIEVADSGLAACIGKECIEDDQDFFCGLIDEVRFYDRKLTSQEIATVMSGGLRTDGSLAGLWDMEESSGQVVYDRSGRGNNGTLGKSSSADASDPMRVPPVTTPGPGPGPKPPSDTGWPPAFTFDNDAQYQQYVTSNNAEHTYCDRLLPVGRVVNEQPDPKGMLRMRNLKDCNARGSQYLHVIPARAAVLVPPPNPSSGKFCSGYIGLSYKFRTTSGCLQVLWGDKRAPSIMAPDPTAKGGSASSEWARYSVYYVFKATGAPVSMEFELSGPRDTEVVVDDLAFTMKQTNFEPTGAVGEGLGIRCRTHCSDIAGRHEGVVGPEDFLAVTLCSGIPVDMDKYWCLDETFTSDGFTSMDDARYWDWLDALPALRQCGTHTTAEGLDEIAATSVSVNGGCLINAPLLIAGKRYIYDPYNDEHTFLADGLFGLDAGFHVTAGPCTWGKDRLCGRLAKDASGKVYQLHVTDGVVSIANGQSVLTPKPLGSVNIGWSLQNGTSPIQDVAFDSRDSTRTYAYVVPVVVAGVYKAAKVQLGATPSIKQVYECPDYPLYSKGAYEIELDSQGNVYVLDKRDWKDSRLMKFNASGAFVSPSVDPLALSWAPAAFHVSTGDPPILIGACCPPNSAVMFLRSDLSKDGQVAVNDMDYITCITHDPRTKDIWVAGFTIVERPPADDIASGGTIFRQPDYRPMLAKIPSGRSTGSVTAECVCDYTSGENDYLALPLSMIWIDP